mmetsp:Transcript_24535/g.52031  ORF Transcript_24535/g.52031 Transcript_24535/m.52031 type:complete len:257 (-) Transcript_24535:512-1282(-)
MMEDVGANFGGSECSYRGGAVSYLWIGGRGRRRHVVGKLKCGHAALLLLGNDVEVHLAPERVHRSMPVLPSDNPFGMVHRVMRMAGNPLLRRPAHHRIDRMGHQLRPPLFLLLLGQSKLTRVMMIQEGYHRRHHRRSGRRIGDAFDLSQSLGRGLDADDRVGRSEIDAGDGGASAEAHAGEDDEGEDDDADEGGDEGVESAGFGIVAVFGGHFGFFLFFDDSFVRAGGSGGGCCCVRYCGEMFGPGSLSISFSPSA